MYRHGEPMSYAIGQLILIVTLNAWTGQREVCVQCETRDEAVQVVYGLTGESVNRGDVGFGACHGDVYREGSFWWD